MIHKGLNQLLCAAVVNDRFRETLLRNPAQALALGYSGQSFTLTAEERDLVIGIRAQHLEDFAAQLYSWISGNGHTTATYPGRNGKGHSLNGYGVRGQNPLVREPLAELVRAPGAA